jgi:hypothetical protein
VSALFLWNPLFLSIKQLKELNAFRIISTHDLDLAVLAEEHEIVTNYSFNSSIREGEMILTMYLPKDCVQISMPGTYETKRYKGFTLGHL